METIIEAKPKLISVRALFREANNIYKTKFGTLLKIAVVPAAIIFIGTLFGIMGSESLGGLFAFAGAMVGILSTIALVYAIKDNVSMSEAYKLSYRKFFSYAWISILGGIIMAGGFLMFIIPTIIFSIWFVLAAYILIIDGEKGMSALLKSKEYIRGYWWAAFGRVFAIILVILVAYIAVTSPLSFISENISKLASPIMQIFITPFIVAYYVSLYRDFKRVKPGLVSVTVTTRRGFFVFSAVLGVVAMILLLFVLILLGGAIPNALPQ